MATQPKRWAVRFLPCDRVYYLYAIASVEKRPYKRNGKWIGLGKAGLGNQPHGMGIVEYEQLFPERYHLKPGGGPVLIEFKGDDGKG